MCCMMYKYIYNVHPGRDFTELHVFIPHQLLTSIYIILERVLSNLVTSLCQPQG